MRNISDSNTRNIRIWYLSNATSHSRALCHNTPRTLARVYSHYLPSSLYISKRALALYSERTLKKFSSECAPRRSRAATYSNPEISKILVLALLANCISVKDKADVSNRAHGTKHGYFKSA